MAASVVDFPEPVGPRLLAKVGHDLWKTQLIEVQNFVRNHSEDAAHRALLLEEVDPESRKPLDSQRKVEFPFLLELRPVELIKRRVHQPLGHLGGKDGVCLQRSQMSVDPDLWARIDSEM